MKTWNTIVRFADGSEIKELVLANTEKAARTTARKLALQRRPFLGSRVEVSAEAKK